MVILSTLSSRRGETTPLRKCIHEEVGESPRMVIAEGGRGQEVADIMWLEGDPVNMNVLGTVTRGTDRCGVTDEYKRKLVVASLYHPSWESLPRQEPIVVFGFLLRADSSAHSSLGNIPGSVSTHNTLVEV